jgi:hypothetical protein
MLVSSLVRSRWPHISYRTGIMRTEWLFTILTYIVWCARSGGAFVISLFFAHLRMRSIQSTLASKISNQACWSAAWSMASSNISATVLEFWGQTGSSYLPLVFTQWIWHDFRGLSPSAVTTKFPSFPTHKMHHLPDAWSMNAIVMLPYL